MFVIKIDLNSSRSKTVHMMRSASASCYCHWSRLNKIVCNLHLSLDYLTMLCQRETLTQRHKLREDACVQTNSIEQSPPWEADSHSSSQEIPRFLWNPNVHYCVHNSPWLVPVLSQINPISTFPPCFSEFHLNITSHLRLRLPNGLLPSGFSTKNSYAFLISPIRATCPAHLILLDLFQ
jgi:hypothetical protein